MERKEVSVIAAMKGDKILYGKRRDNGKWTNPGGHLDPHEDPLDGAVRELQEETGIVMPKESFKHLKTKDIKNNYRIHAYTVNIPENVGTSMKDDPDNEVERWHWMTLPFSKEVMDNLHSPDNIILQELGMQKTAFWAGFEKQAISRGAYIKALESRVTKHKTPLDFFDSVDKHLKSKGVKNPLTEKDLNYAKSFLKNKGNDWKPVKEMFDKNMSREGKQGLNNRVTWGEVKKTMHLPNEKGEKLSPAQLIPKAK